MELVKGSVVSIFVIILLINGIHPATPKGHHTLLAENLLKDYGPTFSRPVHNFNQTIVVHIYLFVSQIIQLIEREQTLRMSANLQMEWKDEYLTWNTSEYPSVTTLNIPASLIWRPDIHLYENVDKRYQHYTDVFTVVHPDGRILWLTPAILTTSCRIDARFFPFDNQKCRLRFGSWVHGISQMDLLLTQTTNPHTYYVPNGVWDLTTIRAERVSQIWDGFEEVYPEIVFELVLTRRPLYYILTVITPCFMLSLINLMVFILPTESGEKVSLGITNVLALVLFQQLIGESIPPVSDKSPFISGYYFTPMIIIGCVSVISGVSVAYLHHQPTTSKVPAWVGVLLWKCSFFKPRRCEFRENDDIQKANHEQRNESAKYDVSNSANNDNNAEDTYSAITDDGYGNKKLYYNWVDVAAQLDRLMMITCISLTLLSLIVTALMFVLQE